MNSSLATAVQPNWVVTEKSALHDSLGKKQFDHRVLLQDVWWIDKEHVPHIIDKMGRKHIHNVYKMIRNNPFFYTDARVYSAVESFLDGITTPGESPDFDLSLIRNATEGDVNEWVLETPLMVKMKKLIDQSRTHRLS